MRALVLNDEEPGDLPLDGRGDQHGSRLGRSLNSRGNVGRFPEHLAGRVDDDGAAFKSDARDQFRNASAGVARVEFCKRALDGQGGAHSALGVVFLGLRVAKKGHQPVAEFPQHVAAKPRHGVRRLVEIGIEDIAPVFHVEPRGEAGRTDQIAEHHRDRAALGIQGAKVCGAEAGAAATSRRLGSAPFGRHTRCYGLQQSFAVAERDAELFEVAVSEIGEHVHIDLVVAKLLPVLTEAKSAQPFADIHSRAPYGLPGYSLFHGAPSSSSQAFSPI